jgi:parvulin-like peptidyl-prolyl isomerase
MTRAREAFLLDACAAGRLTPAEQRELAAQVRPRREGRVSWFPLLLVAACCLAADPSAPPVDSTFATINGVDMPYGAFYAELQDAAGGPVAQTVIIDELMRQEATRLGIMPTPAEVDSRCAEVIAEDFEGSSVKFTEWLQEKAKDTASFRRLMTNDLLDLRLRARGVTATDDDIKAYFAANRTKLYTVPEAVRYREIVFDDKTAAEKAIVELTEGKIQFFEAAHRYSVDQETGPEGGLVSWQPMPLLDQIAPTLAAALRKLAVDEFTKQPVLVDKKWYVVLLVEKKAAQELTFEQVAPRVRRDYLLSKAVPERTYFAAMSKAAKVTGLPTRYHVVEAEFGQGERPAPGLGPTPTQP